MQFMLPFFEADSPEKNWSFWTFCLFKATGLPRQATGPPRSGAGVGVGMLRGNA